jgi:spermidine/putrescine-binding protein
MAKKLSRRDFLLATAATTASISMMVSCKKAPALVTSLGEFDLTKTDQVRLALEREGAEVQIHTWGFEGLRAEIIPAKFAEYTQKKYGIAVKYVFSTENFGNLMNELPIAKKTAVDVGIDVIDKEEEYWPRLKALEWTEPIDQEGYAPILENVKKVEDAYLIRQDPKVNGSNLHGTMYQGFEWLQAILRKDKVDVNNYKDWTDLARPEMKDKGVLYAMNDSRGQFVFMGILNSLIKQGIVKGNLWTMEAWEEGFKWWKANMEDKIHKWGDIGNDAAMRLMLETGEVWWGGTWGVYTRAMLALPWNKRDNALWAFYPKSGILADRETCFVAKGCKHPVAARVLIDWMMSTEFVHAGWFKDEKGVEQNRWGITEDKYLALYTGGVFDEHRKLMPEFAKPFYPADPGSLILTCDWDWWSPKREDIAKAYERIVHS